MILVVEVLEVGVEVEVVSIGVLVVVVVWKSR
jgi:hypothetical protein